MNTEIGYRIVRPDDVGRSLLQKGDGKALCS